MYYQKLIHEMDKTINPAGVEGSMRLQFSVLDHLDRHDFLREIQVGKDCERYEPGSLSRMADTHGLRADYDRWESGKLTPDVLRPEVYTAPVD